MRRAIEGLPISPEHVLIDGRRLKTLHLPQQAIIKGDGKSLTIAAALDSRQDCPGRRDEEA